MIPPEHPAGGPSEPDRLLAARIGAALQTLAGEEAGAPPPPARAGELVHEASTLLGCLAPGRPDELSRRRTRWKVLLRRSLQMAAASYRRLLTPEADDTAPLVQMLRGLGLEAMTQAPGQLDLASSARLARAVAASESRGLRSILILGSGGPLAVALAHLSGQRVVLMPWDEPDRAVLEGAAGKLGAELHVEAAADPLHELPLLLRQRFQCVLVRPPLAGVGAQRAMLAAVSALEPGPGTRLYWTGHPGRNLDYFSMYSLLGRKGYFLEKLFPEALTMPVDPELPAQLLADLLETPEAGRILDPELLDGLNASGQEHEHLHRCRPVGEVVLQGAVLELVPVTEAEVPRYDAWLTPEFCHDVGFDAERPRPTTDELRLPHWYPDHEWWMARTRDGHHGLGMVHLMLSELWTKRSMPWDVGITERSFRGQGLLNEVVRLGFYRVFEQLGADALWSDVSVSNVPIRRGARTNFFRTLRRHHAADGEELERIHITATEYRQRRASGEIAVPAGETD